jgi:hypothetical protein
VPLHSLCYSLPYRLHTVSCSTTFCSQQHHIVLTACADTFHARVAPPVATAPLREQACGPGGELNDHIRRNGAAAASEGILWLSHAPCVSGGQGESACMCWG